MNAKELQLKTETELKNLLAEGKDRLGNLGFILSNKSKDTSEAKKIRKDIARILTVLKKRRK